MSSKFGAVEPGMIIADRYQIIELLGSGAMGQVLKTVDMQLDNSIIAIKLLFPHLVRDPIVSARFRNEILVSRNLAHPNIVRVYDYGKASETQFYLTMEFIDGKSLSKFIYGPRYEKLSFYEICCILSQIAKGIAYAHCNNVIHRDLKPDNILINKERVPKIMDFGLARSLLVDKGLTQTGETVGTPYYMSPEQIRGDPCDGRTDLYSLGIMAYELAVGQRPFQAEGWLELAAMHLSEPLPKFSSELGFPSWYRKFIDKCCEKKVENRFESVQLAADFIDGHLQESQSFAIKRVPSVMTLYLRDSARLRRRKNLLARIKKPLLLSFAIGLLAVGLVSANFKPTQLSKILPNIKQLKSSLLSFYSSQLGIISKDLFEAIKTEDLDTISALMDGGASALDKDDKGNNAFIVALNSEHLRAFELLVKKTDSDQLIQQKLIFLAVKADKEQAIRILTQHGVDTNQKNEQGETALVLATRLGKYNSAKALIESGAFVNIIDSAGNGAIHYAVDNADLNILHLLCEVQQINIDLRDERGMTPLMLALEKGQFDIARMLVEYGARPDVTDRKGRLALSYAPPVQRSILGGIKQRNRSETQNNSIPLERNTDGINKNSRKEKSGETNNYQGMTRLRPRGKPHVRWERNVIKEASITIWNAGSNRATDVKAFLVTPSGDRIELFGPNDIEPNQTTVYQRKDLDILLTQTGRFKSEALCQNCFLP